MGACNAISAAHEVLDRTGLVKKEQLDVTANTGPAKGIPAALVLTDE